MKLNKVTIQTIGSSNTLPSQYVRSIKDVIRSRPHPKTVLFARESGRVQDWCGNLKAQKRSLKRKLERLGCKVLKVFATVASGWDDDREVFRTAARFAMDHGAILGAESAGRFLRSVQFNTQTCPHQMPSGVEWENLVAAAGPVVLATLLHPDADLATVRSCETRRGIEEKQSRCGRPARRVLGTLKKRREKLLPIVLRMRVRRYFSSYGFISYGLDLPKSTVKRWCDKHAA